jgi:hypothetical protein
MKTIVFFVIFVISLFYVPMCYSIDKKIDYTFLQEKRINYNSGPTLPKEIKEFKETISSKVKEENKTQVCIGNNCKTQSINKQTTKKPQKLQTNRRFRIFRRFQ